MSSGNPRTRDLMETAWEWLEFADRVILPPNQVEKIEKEMVDKKCQCGLESIGGGIHSSWCNKYEGE
jgi:hypothetical protein